MLDSMLSDISLSPEDSDEPMITLDDLDTPSDASKPQILEAKDFPISKMFFCGDFREVVANFQAESIDHVVTDIPYGIDMSNLDTMKDIDTVVDTHHVEQNVEMMRPFLAEAFRVLKPNGFCVFWYDLNHHEKLQAWAKEVGFKLQSWPLVWHKLHPCRNNAATKNYTKDVEFAMVLRKGNAVLNKPQSTCVIAADNSVERKMYDNPFAKPGAVWRFIYDAIAYKGQVTADFFAGQFSSARAALDCGLTPIMVEIDQEHFLKGVNGVKQKLKTITNNTATFS
jgi:DNA modification methylase